MWAQQSIRQGHLEEKIDPEKAACLWLVKYPSLQYTINTYICTVTPFSRRSLTRIIDEMISWPNLSKIRAFQSIPPFSLLFEEVGAGVVSKTLSAWVAFRLSMDATAAVCIQMGIHQPLKLSSWRNAKRWW